MESALVTLSVSRQSARERDLDNLLLEELASSVDFREWFLEKLAFYVDVPEYSHARVRKNENRESEVGQTDLGLTLIDNSGQEQCLILIENKVHSGFQEGQPERYRGEVNAARSRLGVRRAVAVLVAPAANQHLVENPGHQCFEVEISIEEIVIYLEKRADEIGHSHEQEPFSEEISARLRNKALLLKNLLGMGPRQSWSPRRDPERASFMSAYHSLAEKSLGRDFTITASSGGKGSTTILFSPRNRNPGGLPVQNIRHDFGNKHEITLVLRDFASHADAIRAAAKSLQGAQIEKGKPSKIKGRNPSLLVRLPISKLDVNISLSDQQSAVDGAFTTIKRLLDWATSTGLTVS